MDTQVERGVRLLDELAPDWWKTVATSRLSDVVSIYSNLPIFMDFTEVILLPLPSDVLQKLEGRLPSDESLVEHGFLPNLSNDPWDTGAKANAWLQAIEQKWRAAKLSQ